MEGGWIGVDLDGTLAFYDGWKNGGRIGEPIPTMAARVRQWLNEGKDVRIVTARVSGRNDDEVKFETQRIQDWTQLHFKCRIPVTSSKDFRMVELWDDRAVQVEKNTGRVVGDDVKLRVFVQDLVENGLRCDMTPTLDLQNYSEQLLRYFAEAHERLKERARQALG